VRGAIAFLAAFVLLVPLMGLLGASCAQAPCCTGTFCPLPAGHGHSPAQPGAPPLGCHHGPTATPTGCDMKSCDRQKLSYDLAPLPPVVLDAGAQLPQPGFARAPMPALTEFLPSGFRSIPSPPPRS